MHCYFNRPVYLIWLVLSVSIVENLIEFRPEVSKEVADAGLLVWLTKKLKVKTPFDNNKLYASEILSILLQNEPENRKGR